MEWDGEMLRKEAAGIELDSRQQSQIESECHGKSGFQSERKHFVLWYMEGKRVGGRGGSMDTSHRVQS